jgi:hypothetical protein
VLVRVCVTDATCAHLRPDVAAEDNTQKREIVTFIDYRLQEPHRRKRRRKFALIK